MSAPLCQVLPRATSCVIVWLGWYTSIGRMQLDLDVTQPNLEYCVLFQNTSNSLEHGTMNLCLCSKQNLRPPIDTLLKNTFDPASGENNPEREST